MSHPLGTLWPRTLNRALHDTNIDTSIAKQVYVVCPKENCSALYELSDSPKTCTCTSFQKVCGTSLGYYTNLAHGKKKWKPHKIFQFIPPSSSLKKMYDSTEFHSLLEQRRAYPSGVLEDIKDGRIWKEFMNSNFFTSKYRIGLMMSVDWFRPLKRLEYKVAAILLTILNLPREERFKKKWTIIAGM